MREVNSEVFKRNQLHTFAVLPSVGSSNPPSDDGKVLQALENCERKLNTSLRFVHLTFLVSYSEDREEALRA
jgi:hypothetical protein